MIIMHFSLVWSALEVVSGLACQWAEWRRRSRPDRSVDGGVTDEGATVTVRVAVSTVRVAVSIADAGVMATAEVVVTFRLTLEPGGREQLEAAR